MRNTKEKGFTIVELTITISLIAILNSLLIPIFANLIAKTKNTARQTNLKNAYEDYCLKNAKNAVLYSQNELIFAKPADCAHPVSGAMHCYFYCF